MSISIRSQRGPHGVARGRLRTRARRMLDALGRLDSELSVVLVDDTIMQSLNATYRGKDQTTDVLSFAMTEGDFGDVNPDVLGDVVISVPTARRQATQARQPLLDRVTFLLAHGLLHLIGYDHETDEQHREMTRQTKRLMRKALDPKTITNKK